MYQNLAGCYLLKSHGTFDSDNIFKPTSPFLEGELIYSSDGFLSVQINFKEKLETNKDSLSYCGTYKIVSDTELIHEVHFSNRTERNNTSEARNYLLTGNILQLTIIKNNRIEFEANWIKQNV